MDIYLVRHGQTDGNVARRHQHTDTRLNPVGIEQAKKVAQFLATLKPNRLISSTYVRALQTANIIGEVCHLLPETDSAFEELHQPDFMIGKRLPNLQVMSYMFKWYIGVKEASMHDGETYLKFLDRLTLARKHLESLPEDARVIVATHSVFITFFLAHMRHPGRMSLFQIGFLFLKMLTIANTSVTHVRFIKSDNPRKTGWQLVHKL